MFPYQTIQLQNHKVALNINFDMKKFKYAQCFETSVIQMMDANNKNLLFSVRPRKMKKTRSELK